MTPSILIVEDETVLRASMARALAKLPAMIDEAATVGEAIAFLDRGLPDVIISDLDLPDGSGIELIGELGKRKARVPVVFVTAYLRAYRAQIPPHADVEVREKPIALDELRALVRERLRTEGDATPFGAADYIQLACLGKHSVVIDVHGRELRGRIEVVEGEVWHAEDAHGRGLDAFRRLVFAADTEVHCRTMTGGRGPRTIDGKWEALLIDSARAHDEEQRSGADALEDEVDLLFSIPDASLDAAWPPDPLVTEEAPPASPSCDDEFGAHYDRAIEALLVRDYAAAAQAFAAAHALRPDDGRVIANLERLAALGFSAPAPTTEDPDV